MSGKVEKIKLNDNTEMPILGLGTWKVTSKNLLINEMLHYVKPKHVFTVKPWSSGESS